MTASASDRPASLPRRFFRAPALHFAVAGALLFCASRALVTASGGASQPLAESLDIVVDAGRIRGLKRDYALGNQVEPTEAESRALVDKLVDEEILFREAVARGFDKDDRSIQYRLVQKMRYLGEDHGEDHGELAARAMSMGLHLTDPIVRNILVEKIRLLVGRVAPRPSEAELEAWFAAHASEYQQASRVTLRQVFFDKGRRGDDGARRDAEAAAVLASGHGGDPVPLLRSDPFVMGSQLSAQGRQDLVKFFGPAFADEVLSLPVGAWSKPIQSTYGWHLVLVEKRFEARTPALAEVRSRVEKSYEADARERRVRQFLEQMRASYTVRVDEEAIREKVGRG